MLLMKQILKKKKTKAFKRGKHERKTKFYSYSKG